MSTPIIHFNAIASNFKAALVGAVIWAWIASPGVAGDWIPPKCCPETDCSENRLKVTEERGGFRVEGVAELVAYGDPRLQPSMDGKIHACVRSEARPWMSETEAAIKGVRREVKCLFVPFTG
jgi:hypothetical protein